MSHPTGRTCSEGDCRKLANGLCIGRDDDRLDCLRAIRAERDALIAEVREWLCEKCHTVFPGPPQPKCSCVICPQCGGATKPRMMALLAAAREPVKLDK